MALVWHCLLNASKVLTGYENVDDATLPAGAVHFPDKPDLEVAKYRWNGETFVPVRNSIPFTPDGPDAWYAVYRLMRYLNAHPQITLPLPCRVWMDYYRNSFTDDGV